MRISVNQLRVLLLIVNLVLAGSLVYKALGAYKVTDVLLGSDAPSESHPQAVRLEKFKYVEEKFTRTNPTSAVVSAATDLQPQKPPPPELKKPALDVTDGEDGTDEVKIADLPEGPLAKDWEYVHYILRHDDPTKTQARVRKKSDDKKGTARRTGTFPRPTTSTRSSRTRSTRSSLSKSRYRKKKVDSVSFLVSDREIDNEDLEVHFWVHSADQEKLVYWMPGKPDKLYALPFKPEGSYLRLGPMRKELRPEEDEDEDEEDEEEKKNFYIIRTDANPEAAREQRYREILAEETSESKFDPAAGKTRKSGQPGKSGGTSSLKASSRLTPSAGKSTRKGMKDLKDAISKIPKAQQAKFRKDLKDMLQGKK